MNRKAWSWGSFLFIAIILNTILIVISSQNYLLFHTLAEMLSIVIFFSTFIIIWNATNILDNHFLLVVGISSLFYGFLDILHTLSYKGMNIFPNYDANVPTQLWIAARYLQAISFFVGSIVSQKRNVNPKMILFVNFLITSIIIISIFWFPVFPVCYIEGLGLTLFKKISEYIISAFFFLSIFFLYKNRAIFNKEILFYMYASIILTIISELAFTFYIDVYALSNMIGHIFKIFSSLLIYRSIVRFGFSNPAELLARSLKESVLESQKSLERKDLLLHEVHHRITNNLQALSGFITLQEHQFTDLKSKEISKELQNRIQTISLIHMQLYNSTDLQKISYHQYFSRLGKYLFKIYDVSSQRIKLILNIENISLKMDNSINIGLIVNELFTNSLKYAFPNNISGEISISFKLFDNKLVQLIYRDSGVGKNTQRKEDLPQSFGFELIETFTATLNGISSCNFDNGFYFELQFNLEQHVQKKKITLAWLSYKMLLKIIPPFLN